MFEEIAPTDTLVLVVILAAFLIIGYKVLSVVRNALIIAVLAVAFPYVLNYLFGANFSTSFDAEVQYLTVSLGLYLIYEVLVLVLGISGLFWSIVKFITKPFVWIGRLIKGALKEGKKDKKEEKKNDE